MVTDEELIERFPGLRPVDLKYHVSNYRRMTDTQLGREYLDLMRSAMSDLLFKHYAALFYNVAAVLLKDRGYTHIKNIFGPIEIKEFGDAW